MDLHLFKSNLLIGEFGSESSFVDTAGDRPNARIALNLCIQLCECEGRAGLLARRPAGGSEIG